MILHHGLEVCGKSSCQAAHAGDLFQLLDHLGQNSRKARHMKTLKLPSSMMNYTKEGKYMHAVQKELPHTVIDLNESMIREDQYWNSKMIRECVPKSEPNAASAALGHESSFLLLLEARSLSNWVLFLKMKKLFFFRQNYCTFPNSSKPSAAGFDARRDSITTEHDISSEQVCI